MQWQAAEETIEALRKKISAEMFQSDPDLPRLTVASVLVERVELLLKMDDQEKLLASASSSGIAPFGALFSVQLSEVEQHLTMAALQQQAEMLRIRYQCTRFVTVEMTVLLEGNVADAWGVLGSSATLTACQNWLQAATKAGTVTLTRSGSAIATADLWQQAEEIAFDQAAQWLKTHLHAKAQGMSSMDVQTKLSVAATLTEARSFPMQRETDVATWFSGNAGDAHVRRVG